MQWRLRTLSKATVPGAVAAGATAWSVAGGQGVESAPALIEQIVGLPLTLTRLLFDVLGQGEHFHYLHDWMLGPGLPAATAATVLFLAVSALSVPAPHRPIIERLWPSRPDILDNRFEEAGLDRIDARATDQPFVEREIEMRQLMAFAGSTPKSAPALMTLAGPGGIGKTRLALEWLKRLQALGWDVGQLPPDISARDIERAHFRKKTAVLIDEAGSIPALWDVMDALLEKDRRIAILLADQYPLRPPMSLGRKAQLRIERADKGTLRLDGLSDEALSALMPELTSEACAEAEGRPLYALLGNDPAGELARRAAGRIEKAASHSERMILMTAALAGPMPQEERRRITGPDVSIQRLEVIFEGADHALLRKVLPAVRPEPLADEVVFQLAGDLPEADVAGLIEATVGANPGAVERRLASLWSRPRIGDERSAIRQLLREAFDLQQPERIALLHQEAVGLAAQIDSFTDRLPDGSITADEVAEFTSWLLQLEDFSRLRPFDVEIRRSQADAMADAMLWFGESGQLDELEQMAAALMEMTVQPDLQGDLAIATATIRGASYATMFYAASGQLEEMERWGRRLDEAAETSAAQADARFLTRWCAAAAAQIDAYGSAARFDDLEAIAEKLDAHAVPDSPAVLFFHAKAATDAIAAYARTNNIPAMERWMERLSAALLNGGDESDRDLQKFRVFSAGYAMAAYGHAKNFVEMEKLGGWLLEAAKSDGLADDPDVQAHLARAMAVAILYHGVANRFGDLERWGSRLSDPSEARTNSKILRSHVEASANAMAYYAEAGRFDDLERWGDRMLSYCPTPEIENHDALKIAAMEGASKAMHEYGKKFMFEPLEKWGRELWLLAGGYARLDVEELRAVATRSTNCALKHYLDAGLFGEDPSKPWIEHMAYLARSYRYDLTIQGMASTCGLNYVTQEAQGWPWGDPPGIAAVGAGYHAA